MVTISAANNVPAISIDSPSDGSSATQGTTVVFGGTANDPEDGALGSSIVWSSSIDGAFGNGSSVSVSTLSGGTHTITASVTDSVGATSTDEITFTLAAPTVPPPRNDPPQGSSGGGALGFIGLVWLGFLVMLRGITRNPLFRQTLPQSNDGS